MEEGEDKLVWMQRRKGAEQRTSKGLERRSKRERKWHAHREEKRSKRGG